MHKQYCSPLWGLLVFISVFVFSWQAFAKELTVAVLVTPAQRILYKSIMSQFEQETDIKVIMIAQDDAKYKSYLNQWLRSPENAPDVLYWQASQRLFHLVKQDLILPITDVWQKQHFDDDFGKFKSTVTYQGEVYGLPHSYYQWGLYYKKSLLAKYGGEPKNWQAFMSICRQMKKDGITPLGIGTKHNWPAAAWFDYLNLRINGLDFHKQLLMGQISFLDPRLQTVFKQWKILVDDNFYNENNKELDWNEVIPYIYRDKVGFILIGNFIETYWRDKMISDIGFMAFPTINNDIAQYEEMPIDLFMIPKNTKQPELAKLFIKFIARADIQAKFSAEMGYFPANKSSAISPRLSGNAGIQLLESVQGVSQYFDRDTPPEFDKIATPILADFINNGDIEKTLNGLEKARIAVFLK